MTDLRRVRRFSKAPDLSTLGSEFLNETLISPRFGRHHNNVEVVQHLVISREECHYKFDRSQGKFTLIHSNFLQLKCFFFFNFTDHHCENHRNRSHIWPTHVPPRRTHQQIPVPGVFTAQRHTSAPPLCCCSKL